MQRMCTLNQNKMIVAILDSYNVTGRDQRSLKSSCDKVSRFPSKFEPILIFSVEVEGTKSLKDMGLKISRIFEMANES